MICHFCKGIIDTKKEKYSHIEDYEKEKLVIEIWCHNTCFKKAMNRDLTELEKQAKGMLGKMGQIIESDSFNKMFPKKEVIEFT